jgi:alanyl-tRNA synthetase
LCGDIWTFIIHSETALAKGIRHIVAVTGEAALDAIRVEQQLRTRLNAASDDSSIRSLTKDLEDLKIRAVK